MNQLRERGLDLGIKGDKVIPKSIKASRITRADLLRAAEVWYAQSPKITERKPCLMAILSNAAGSLSN
jgi:hypothetical protein